MQNAARPAPLATLPRAVTVVEVGPRDGLQNENAIVSAPDKVQFIDMLASSGLPVVEMTAFVSPKWIPQMADAVEVARMAQRRPGVRYTALVPNLAGLERARVAGLREIAIFAASSETFSRRNINQTIEDSLATYKQVCDAALAGGMRVRAYLSTSFGCPFEGAVAPERVADISARLIDMGAFEISVSDTIGIAHPGQVPGVVEAVVRRVPIEQVALHFHDTRGTALANVLMALQLGVSTFDASAGGLGGCPYAPGASGNLATEDLIYMLDGLAFETGVRLDDVVTASSFIEEKIGRKLPGRYRQAVSRARLTS